MKHFDDIDFDEDPYFEEYEEHTCEYCGAIMTKSQCREEFWGAPCWRDEWTCPNCG